MVMQDLDTANVLENKRRSTGDGSCSFAKITPAPREGTNIVVFTFKAMITSVKLQKQCDV